MKTKPELGPPEEDRYYGTTANRESCSVLFYYEDEDHESLQTLSLKHPSMGREVRDRSATMQIPEALTLVLRESYAILI
jgi:hypothetical protein